MLALLRMLTLGLVLGAGSLLGPGVVRAEAVPYEDCVKKLFDAVNQDDFKTVYKDLSSSRLRSGSDFAAFAAVMAKARSRLGAVRDYRPEYVFQDNEYQGFTFVRLQLRVQHENGESIDRMVLMQDKDGWLLDGYAIYSQGEFLLARGNLYKFDELDTRLAQEEAPEAKDLATLRDNQAYTDVFNAQAAGTQRKQKYELAVRLAADGNFDEAEKLMKEVNLVREIPIDNPDAAVFKGVRSGQVSRTQAQLYFQAEKARAVDQNARQAIAILEQGLAGNPTFTSGLIYLAVLYLEVEQPALAYEKVQQVLAQEPENIFAHYALAEYYAVMGDPVRAQEEREKVFRQAANFGPQAMVYIEQGFERKYYRDGKLEYECVFVDGIPNGPYKAYFPDGKVKEEGRYKDGKPDGECRVYYRDGRVGMEFRYAAGKLLSLTQYSTAGEVLAEHKL